MNPQVTHASYSTAECLRYVAFASFFWFFLSHVILVETIVLPFMPKLVQTTLRNEADACRRRIRFKKATGDDHTYLLQLRNRIAGILHSVIAVFLALYCITADRIASRDPIFGTSTEWKLTGSFVCGYFIWDLIVILANYNTSKDNWQWLLHAMVSLAALISPFFAWSAPLSYYGPYLILLELSTPFMGFRWLVLRTKTLVSKPGVSNQGEKLQALESMARKSSMGFALMFFLTRIVWGPLCVYVPLLKVLFHEASLFHPVRWWLYVVSIPLFLLLNVYWMCQIVLAAQRLRVKQD